MPFNFIFFLPNVIGGVSSVINNLIAYNSALPDTKVIAYSYSTDQREQIGKMPEGVAFSRIKLNSHNNLFHTLKLLQASMPTGECCLIATDSLELCMVQMLHLQYKVVFIVLGDFKHYYDTAVYYEGIIDEFIAISKEIQDKLVAFLPDRKNDIFQCYFPTPPVPGKRNPRSDRNLKIIYVARLEAEKNVLLLPSIDDELMRLGVKVEWTIVGNGPLRSSLEQVINGKSNFTLTGFLNNDSLHVAYHDHDIYILSSLSEGLPVSLIEAMKTGLVPVVSDIPGGIREIIDNKTNGFLCSPGNALQYAQIIENLDKDRSIVERISQNAIQFANTTFNPFSNSKNYWELFERSTHSKKIKQFKTYNNSLLDKAWMPNVLVRNIRIIKKSLSSLLLNQSR